MVKEQQTIVRDGIVRLQGNAARLGVGLITGLHEPRHGMLTLPVDIAKLLGQCCCGRSMMNIGSMPTGALQACPVQALECSEDDLLFDGTKALPTLEILTPDER